MAALLQKVLADADKPRRLVQTQHGRMHSSSSNRPFAGHRPLSNGFTRRASDSQLGGDTSDSSDAAVTFRGVNIMPKKQRPRAFVQEARDAVALGARPPSQQYSAQHPPSQQTTTAVEDQDTSMPKRRFRMAIRLLTSVEHVRRAGQELIPVSSNSAVVKQAVERCQAISAQCASRQQQFVDTEFPASQVWLQQVYS